jgi:hypothetical protein
MKEWVALQKTGRRYLTVFVPARDWHSICPNESNNLFLIDCITTLSVTQPQML